MDQFQEKVEVIRSERIAADVFRLVLAAPEIAEKATPGQFIMIKVNWAYDPLLRRPFSIFQTSGQDIQIVYKVLGKGTQIMSTFKAGDKIDIIGPLGKGFTVISKNLCLVGGGMGIAPLFFLSKQIVQTVKGAKIQLLLGARTRDELMAFEPGFKALGVQVHAATDDGSAGHHGFVTDLFVKAADNCPADQAFDVYCCGPYPMMRTVAELCTKYGLPCQVSMETMMACGISACLGCAIQGNGKRYLHVCKDGPVFQGGEIKWA
ncbi:MAG: dihydroorotate dehydrogenase electron transfer subunit [Proteobacteria bacterium]|nr:dihydroorotate dehydrogenase electron transfer subunit [Pseudomonadota bacterium]MBU1708575.1 dihydroorotate dehydrogenase electron transfer subunit [Pseudomonadota bacterium]